MRKVFFSYLFLFFTLSGVSVHAQKYIILNSGFDATNVPPVPDYALKETWAALPDKEDAADKIPLNSKLKDGQKDARVDVFFLHPTIYTYAPKNQYLWNADVHDEELNTMVDNSTILNQATAFNGSGRVYAPRYRQAHYYSFLTKNADDKKQALDLAYTDVKSAFEYYLQHWNQGRPIIIASHSQGTVLAKRLLKEFFDGKPLQKQLVEAYLIGIATAPDTFDKIKPSQSAEETGGFVSWNTFARDFIPPYYNDGLDKAICTNPLSWKLNEDFVSKKENRGGVGLKFTFVKEAADAQVHEGILWINKPYVRGRAFLRTKIWHRADINLFWMNIRENVALRTERYFNQQ
ncbi:DUF3089 domain-containing protein [Emticicia sp. BO119]|uniref:DUF3089 domain-containing protein n=1 Tax=Emticicia sp. BO119 TaxID=2757768 RepID=UPI0015F1142A|nr:DUF3089 domain-containing protein [Emticicia sp. BO119]MBA4851711.1 DUF3089 domain-containing protein [Emticicia sp. BO119]